MAAVLYFGEVTGSQSMNLREQCEECGELRPVNIERRAVIFRRQPPPPKLFSYSTTPPSQQPYHPIRLPLLLFNPGVGFKPAP